MVERSFDAFRDMRDAWFERSFHATYEWLATLGIAKVEAPVEPPAGSRVQLTSVRSHSAAP